jgi:hypothetical protein
MLRISLPAITSDQNNATNDLKLVRQRVDVEAGLGETRDAVPAVAASRGRRAQCAVVPERQQRGLGHRVDGERRAPKARMLSTSEAPGSFVPLLAKSDRCGRAPPL